MDFIHSVPNDFLVMFAVIVGMIVCFLLFYRIGTIKERDVWLDAAHDDLIRKNFVTVGKRNFVVVTEDQYTAMMGIKFTD